jgi:mono/diheme cytochrome c family protein
MSGLSRRLARMAGYALIAILLLLVVAISATVGWRPLLGPRMRPVTSRRFEATPARMQRGQYLVENVSLCFGCHTRFDAKGKDVPVLLAGKGSGYVMVNDGDFKVVAPNITPDTETGIGSWSDDEIARAIREGVSRDGRALFPIMPYGDFHKMSDEDLASIVVYLRAQRPVRNDPGRTTLPFPVSRLINAAPQPVNGPVTAPDPSDPVRYGQYLVNVVGDCNGCHTPRDKHGQAIPGMALGGGNPFADSGVTVVSANITPDPSGISYYDEASFVSVMRTGQVRGRKLNVMMPWWAFRNMTDADLKAIYAYLRTIPPVRHRIDNTESATLCPIDGHKHGLGDQNHAP